LVSIEALRCTQLARLLASYQRGATTDQPGGSLILKRSQIDQGNLRIQGVSLLLGTQELRGHVTGWTRAFSNPAAEVF